MSGFFDRIKISSRIQMIMVVAALGMAAIVGIGSSAIEQALFKHHNEQTRRLVETVVTLLQEYQDRVDKGEMTLEEAQKRALTRVSSLRYDKTEYFWINDLNGTMLAHPSAKLVGTDVLKLKDAHGALIFVDMIEKVQKNGGGVYQYFWPPDNTAKRKISYVQAYMKWGWVIGSGGFVDALDEQIWMIKKELGLTSAGILLLVVLTAVLVGRSISRPVRILTFTMEHIAAGDLDIKIGMEDRHDEIGAMAKALQTFQENSRRIKQLENAQEEAKRRAAEEKKTAMNALASGFDRAIGNIVTIVSSSALELQSSAKNLSEMADQTSRQTSTVAAATEQASASVQTVASAAEELSASIGEINRQIEESTKVAGAAVAEVKRTDATVSTLSEAATQIGDVVKLIQDIAEQTNLLALNATIEAARAGEAGKGFAVVASEVKNLANQTAKATEEISKKIVTIQGVSIESVKAIRSIGEVIEQIDSITHTIAEALRQQDSATREISNNVQQASAGTSEVSSSIVNVTYAAKESGHAANEVMEAAGELSKQADTLRREIDSFLGKVREG